MLGKLIKYEFKACGRTFFPIYIGILILSIINGLCSNYSIFQSVEDGFAQNGALMNVQVILMLVLFALFVALFVLTIILIIQRFKKSLLEDEGYLMFTLPVSSKNLILSKYLVSLIFVILSGLVAMLSFILMGIFIENYQFARIMNMIGLGIINMFASDNGIWQAVLVLILGLIMAYTGFVLTIYLSISVGQLPQFNKHRVAAGVIAFFIINMIISYIQNFISRFMDTGMQYTAISNNITFTLTMHDTLLFMINILIAIALFMGTDWILNKKLNKE